MAAVISHQELKVLTLLGPVDGTQVLTAHQMQNLPGPSSLV